MPEAEDRRAWMGLLARAPLDLLRAAVEGRLPEARRLAGPETGLIQLRAQAPVTGTPFHLGEATVTRCVVEIGGRRGYAVVLGGDAERAELAAVCDALLQDPRHHARLAAELLRPAAAAIAERRLRKAGAARATAAHFFTAARTP